MNGMTAPREPFTTQDLYTAAACMVAGHSLTIIKLDNGRARFEFPAEAATAAQTFELGVAGPLLVYASALRRLKKLINQPATHPIDEVNYHVPARRSR